MDNNNNNYIYITAKLPDSRREAERDLTAASGFFSDSEDYIADILGKHSDKAFISSAMGIILLERLMRENNIPANTLTLRREKSGRPYFERLSDDFPIPYFSISHTDNRAMCAVSWKYRIGCDIQTPRDYSLERMKRMARFFMTEEQVRDFSQISADEKKREECFYTLWTRKEACYKCFGGQLAQADIAGAEKGSIHSFMEHGCYCAITVDICQLIVI